VRAVGELESSLTGERIRRDGIAQLADDDRIVAIYRVRAERDDREPLDIQAVAIYRMREGRFADSQIFVSDPEAFNAFWS